MWRKFLRRCFLTGQRDAHMLTTPLGSWLHDADHQTSEVMYDTESQALYLHSEEGTVKHMKLASRRRYSIVGIPSALPPSATVAAIARTKGSIELLQHSPRLDPTPGPRPPINIKQWFRAAPAYIQRLWGDTSIPADGGEWIIQQLLTGHLDAACDGSVKNGLACHGWLINAPHPRSR